jgi:FRG domain
MSGFPHVDSEAYTRIVMLNAGLRHHLSNPVDPPHDGSITTPLHYRQLLKFLAERPDRTFRWLSHNSALLSFPVTQCESLNELQALLTTQHGPQHWYRGQSRQHVAMYEGRLPALDTVRLAFDALIPSFFRNVTIPIPAEWDGAAKTQDLPPLAYVGRPLRAMMNSRQDEIRELVLRFLQDMKMKAIARAMSRQSGWLFTHPATAAQSLPGTNISQSHLDVISLAQHYEFGSLMVDVTKSVEVAGWFASHRYDDGTVIAESDSPGIVYRFDKKSIDAAIATRFSYGDQTQLPTFIPQLGLFGLVDISAFPPHIAQRPGAQHGGSLFGFENSVLHFILCEGGAVEAFTFPHRFDDADVTSLTKEQLCPPDDHALTTFDPTYFQGDPALSDEELRAFLLNSDLATAERDNLVRLHREGVL